MMMEPYEDRASPDRQHHVQVTAGGRPDTGLRSHRPPDDFGFNACLMGERCSIGGAAVPDERFELQDVVYNYVG